MYKIKLENGKYALITINNGFNVEGTSFNKADAFNFQTARLLHMSLENSELINVEHEAK